MNGPDLRHLATEAWPEDWRAEFEERAAFIEEGNLGVTRAEAEKRARVVVIGQWLREQREAGR